MKEENRAKELFKKKILHFLYEKGFVLFEKSN